MSKSIKVGICQVNPILGNFDYNYQKLLDNYNQAIDKGANLVIFPAMVVTGYPPQDLLFSKSFINKSEYSLKCLINVGENQEIYK